MGKRLFYYLRQRDTSLIHHRGTLRKKLKKYGMN